MRYSSLVLTASIVCSTGIGFSSADAIAPGTAKIMLDIGRVDKKADESARIDATKNMLDDITKVWQAGKMNQIDDSAIDALVPLLDDDSDVVRGWAACAIGYFGPRARRSLPALQAAQDRRVEDINKERLVIAPAVDSLAFIEVAKKRVEGVSERDIFPEH